jgi:hypothetical protein
LAPLVLVLTFGLAGCGNTLDSEDLEGQLVDEFAPDFDVDPDDASGDCPDDIEIEEGTEFECTLSAPDRGDLTVEVTLTDDDGAYEAEVPPEQFEQP